MTETSINLGCAKINIKRDTKHYAPWHVINPRLLNIIPEGAKTYKLSPSTTLFFKMTCCSNLNFGWRQIKTIKKIKTIKRNTEMFERKISEIRAKSYPSTSDHDIYHECYGQLPSFREDYLRIFHNTKQTCQFYYLQVERMKLPNKYKIPMLLFSSENDYATNQHLLDEHKKQIRDAQSTEREKKSLNFLHKTALFFAESVDEIKASLKSNAEKRKEKMMCTKERRLYRKENSLGYKLTSFFQQQERLPVIIENVIPNETIVPNAPPIVQPDRNPEYQEGTTINNYNFNITCGIL